jgi:general secretion pathway protein E
VKAQVVNLAIDAGSQAGKDPASQADAGGDVVPVAANDRIPGLKERLVQGGALPAREYNKVESLCASSADDKRVIWSLASLGLVAERELAQAVADVTGLRLADDADYAAIAVCDEPIAARFLRERLIFPAKETTGRIELVMMDPGDTVSMEAIRFAYRMPVDPVVGVRSDIERAIDAMYGSAKTESGETADDARAEDDFTDVDVDQLRDMASEAPVIRLVNVLLQNANDSGASDIHIEPFDGRLKVRNRIDGVLHETDAPPVQLSAAVISRIKIMAKLDIAERRLPQDGRIRLRLQGRDIDARVSTIPTMHGESVVMRLLNRGDVALDLEPLGFSGSVRQSFLDALRMPNGMILVTGPTGSGKTTTLYTAIHILNTEQRKIITAEDPVEYQMEGVNQIQVKPAIGLTFANVLRSIVRQDPDVILVGEMRDLETARICVQSALTGHLVLSTLHTNSAASSVTRLLEMGIEDYLLASTLNAIVSQRLVRLLCDDCKESYRPPPGVADELGLLSIADTDEILLYRPVGCSQCNGTGYRGRHAILEVLTIDDELRDLVQSRKGAREIEAAAVRGGMRTIFADGCSKALAGVTSIEEVLRVIQDG